MDPRGGCGGYAQVAGVLVAVPGVPAEDACEPVLDRGTAGMVFEGDAAPDGAHAHAPS